VPIIEGARPRTAQIRASYDFAVDGGAVGTITLRGQGVPAGATVLGGYIEVFTPLTSGGAATAAAQVEGAGDLLAASVITGAPWSTAGRKSLAPAFGSALVRATTARAVQLVVAVAALTAGKFDVMLLYSDV
jgi:hypothetical protein